MTQEKEALKLALEFIERVNKDGWILADFEPQMYAVMTAIKEVLAQPEQEPCDMKDMCIGCSPRNANGSCPDAPRKPLTDEQIEDEWEKETGHSIFGGDRSEGRAMYISPDEVVSFVRNIEAAHGIKR